MKDRTPAEDSPLPSYEIRLQGRLGPRWAARFDGMTLDALDDGTTVLVGHVADQAALHGLLTRLGDLGIPLLSVRQQDTDTTTPDTTIPPNPPGD